MGLSASENELYFWVDNKFNWVQIPDVLCKKDFQV